MDEMLKITDKYNVEFIQIDFLGAHCPELLRSPFDPIPAII